MTDRLERRRQTRAARKDAKRSAFVDYPTEGVAPLSGSALYRARELFAQACETGEEHTHAGLSVRDIRDIEAERRVIPNRAMARRHGIRSGYTARLHRRLVAVGEIRRMETLMENETRLEAHKKRREDTLGRAQRRAERHNEFRVRAQEAMAAAFDAGRPA